MRSSCMLGSRSRDGCSSSSKYRSSVSTRLHPDTDDLQKWIVFSMSSKYRSSVSTRLQPDTDDLQKKNSYYYKHVGILRCQNTGPLCQPGSMLGFCVVQIQYRSSVSTRLHPDTDDLQKQDQL